ncbi:MAG: hypothetical protein OEV85_02545 [Candidatus Thorarchaeota archaeon]|nr:hypothetical protein [Candidatus Thorarchaeota archaeon]
MSDSEYSLGPEKEVVFWELVNLPSTTYGTFGLYRQSAKFIPHVVVVVLENYDKQGMNVFDPFARDGTVGTLYTYTAITVKCGLIIQLSNYIIVPHCWSPYESMFTSYRFNPKNIIEGDFGFLYNLLNDLGGEK